jgi:hypothetical protein
MPVEAETLARLYLCHSSFFSSLSLCLPLCDPAGGCYKHGGDFARCG